MVAKIADSADLVAATEWSRQVYKALKDWDPARGGRWSTWEEGGLMLTIDRTPAGAPCAPVNILAAANIIGFATRGWETQLPQPGQSFDQAIGALKELTMGWFNGELALAAFFLGDEWKGSTAIDPLRLQEEIAVAFQWIAAQAQVDRVEIQTASPENDQFFGLAVDGAPLAARAN
jgi:hypothetical protein